MTRRLPNMRGSGLDLAIASAILAADGQIPSAPLADAIIFAELGLDGRAPPIRGAVVAAVATLRSGRRRIVVARRNAAEAAVVPAVEAVAVSSLRRLPAAAPHGHAPGSCDSLGCVYSPPVDLPVLGGHS